VGDPHGGLVLDETGIVTKRRHSAGGARQYTGTVGTVENGHIGVCWGDASPRGQLLLARELYVPAAWTQDRERCRQAGIPADRGVATTPQRARQLRARALGSGVPAHWGTGDGVYGHDRRLRRWLEARPPADGLAVSGTAYGWGSGQPRQVNTRLAALPRARGTRLRAGEGAQGPRWDDGRWRPLAAPLEPSWCRWRLVRRRLSAPAAVPA